MMRLALPHMHGRAGAAVILLTVVDHAATYRSSLAILEADQVAVGPVAWVYLTHHVPLSFHGYWHAGRDGLPRRVWAGVGFGCPSRCRRSVESPGGQGERPP